MSRIKKILENLRINFEELARFIDPDDTVCIFEPERGTDVKLIEKRFEEELKNRVTH